MPARVEREDYQYLRAWNVLKVDLGGASAGTGFDQVEASGFGVQLGGTLDLTMINNYQPTMLVPHQVVAADAVSGRFDAVNGALLSPTRALAVTYGEEAVFVTATLPGDATLDGIISGDDYAAIDFAVNIPGASGWSNGDFNYDNVISGDDYSIIDFNLVAQGEAL